MKAIKFFAMLICAAAMTFGAASCGDDDDENDGSTGESIAELMELSPKKATLKGTSTEISLTVDYGKYTEKTLAKFSETKEGTKILTSWLETVTFSSAKVAQAAYDLIQTNLIIGEEKEYVDLWKKSSKVSKNSIIVDIAAIAELEEEDMEMAYEFVEAWMVEDYLYAVKEGGATGSVSGFDISEYEKEYKASATRAESDFCPLKKASKKSSGDSKKN